MRGANLASIYRDAGMTDVSVREAARAVTYDYANDSAHLFLSDSYNELRDPTRFNLRYETVWFNELLLANSLSPVGAGRLSQTGLAAGILRASSRRTVWAWPTPPSAAPTTNR